MLFDSSNRQNRAHQWGHKPLFTFFAPKSVAMAPRKGKLVIVLSYDKKKALQSAFRQGTVQRDRYEQTKWFNKRIEASWKEDIKKLASYKKEFFF